MQLEDMFEHLTGRELNAAHPLFERVRANFNEENVVIEPLIDELSNFLHGVCHSTLTVQEQRRLTYLILKAYRLGALEEGWDR